MNTLIFAMRAELRLQRIDCRTYLLPGPLVSRGHNGAEDDPDVRPIGSFRSLDLHADMVSWSL